MMEKEVLGFYITGHPLNKYKQKLDGLSVTPTTELHELQDKQDVIIGGIVREFKQIQTKRKGDLMAYLTVEDLYGTVEIIAFPDIYKESKNIISMNIPVVISGYIDKTDKGLKIVAKKITSIDDGQIIKQKTQTSHIPDSQYKSVILTMHNNTTLETLSKLDNIFLKYSGDCPVYLKIISPKQWEILLLTSRHVTPSMEMISEVENLLGKGTAILNSKS
jgi:DNA polymerase-3 subunit alpha